MTQLLACAQCGTKNRIPEEKAHLAAKCGRCGASMRRLGEVAVLTDRNFNQVVEGAQLPVLVDFYAPTCGPCRMLAPVIATLARNYGDRVVVAKLDTSANHLIPGRFGIRGVPTLLFFHRGQVVEQMVGVQPQQVIEQRLQQMLRQ